MTAPLQSFLDMPIGLVIVSTRRASHAYMMCFIQPNTRSAQSSNETQRSRITCKSLLCFLEITTNFDVRPHLKSREQHNLFHSPLYISNFHPPFSTSQELALLSNWTKPDSADLFVAVCKRCWNDIEESAVLIFHINKSCSYRQPGKHEKWKVLYSAFCEKLYLRRYTTVASSPVQHQDIAQDPLRKDEAGPSTERQDVHVTCIPLATHLALENRDQELEQQIANVLRHVNASATPRLSPTPPFVPNARNVGQNAQNNAEPVGPVTPQALTANMTFRSALEIPIDPNLKPLQSSIDSGLGSSVSQAGSGGASPEHANSQLPGSQAIGFETQNQQVVGGDLAIPPEDWDLLIYSDPRQSLIADHRSNCSCQECQGYAKYRRYWGPS